jgi:hypothetical protein
MKLGHPTKKSYRPSFEMVQKKFAWVISLREKGLPWSDIAKKVGRARQTVADWCKYKSDGLYE